MVRPVVADCDRACLQSPDVGIGYHAQKSADEKAFYMINLAGYNIGCYSSLYPEFSWPGGRCHDLHV